MRSDTERYGREKGGERESEREERVAVDRRVVGG